jgi:hypothetical protein
MRVIGSVTPAVTIRKEEPRVGGWITARAPGSEDRSRYGKQVVANLFGGSSSALAYSQRSQRLLTSEQLWQVYQRTADVRAAVDGVARRVSTWDWIVEPADGYEHDPAAQQLAKDYTKFLLVPNEDGETWQEIIHKVALDQLVYDVGVIEHVFDTVVVDGEMRPGTQLKELTALRGANVHKILTPHGKLVRYVQDQFIDTGFGLTVEYDSPSAVFFEPRQISFFPLTPNTTTPEAVPLIEAIVNEVITILNSSEHAMLAFDSDELPPGIVFLAGIAGKAAEAAKADLQNMRGKDHKVRVMTSADPQASGAKWVEFRRSQKDVDFVNVVKEIRRTIWRVFGVLPVEMGATENVPKAVGQVQLDVSASHLIGPMLEHIENKVNARILPLLAGDPLRAQMVRFRFDREAKLTPAEEQDRSQAIGAMVDRGILTRNEARRRMGESPVLGGDVVTLTTGQGVLLLTDIVGLTGPLSPGGGDGSAPPEPITPQSLYPEPGTRAVGDTDPTNFPKRGDDLKVSLRNSEYRVFDPEFAEDLRVNWPEIWKRGGNILGNTQYRRLKPVVGRGGSVETETEEMAVRLREAWSARHYGDHRLPGVVALIKWFTVGEIGESQMKSVIREEKQRLMKRKIERAIPSDWASDGRFADYRTIDLEELGSLVEEYQADVDGEWQDTTAAIAAILLAFWKRGGMDSASTIAAQERIASELAKLEDKWSLITQSYYQQAAQMGEDAGIAFTGGITNDEAKVAAELYHQEAMGWLRSPGGLMMDVESTILENLTQLTRTNDNAIAEYDTEDAATAAVALAIAPLIANRFRIHNYSGKLVMLANETASRVIAANSSAVNESGDLVSADWYVQWLANLDDRTCSDCVVEADKPIRPLGELVTFPGGDTQCGARCRCVLVYWTKNEVETGESVDLRVE